MMRQSILLWSTLGAILADQASKYVVVHGMSLAQRQVIDLLPPLLTFRYGENRGINFGLFQGDGDAARSFGGWRRPTPPPLMRSTRGVGSPLNVVRIRLGLRAHVAQGSAT